MSETFAPLSNGWRLQRGYSIIPQFEVIEDARELGNIASTAVADRVRRLFEGVVLRTDSRDALEYLESFFSRLKGPAARFWLDWPELVSSPDAAPTVAAIAGGSQAERTITVRMAWRNTNGTTKASPTASIVVPASELLQVTIYPYPPTATHCVLYAAEDDPGGEQEQVALAGARTWTQPDAPLLLATADPPAANTATQTLYCKLVGGYRVSRGNGTTYEATMSLEEVYA